MSVSQPSLVLANVVQHSAAVYIDSRSDSKTRTALWTDGGAQLRGDDRISPIGGLSQRTCRSYRGVWDDRHMHGTLGGSRGFNLSCGRR